MTTKHLLILTLVVIGTMSAIFMLPQQLGYQPVGIILTLPEFAGAWWGHPAAVTPEEHQTLGPDTEIVRRNYENGSADIIQTSIVLAGQDMMTGLHRPERCLNAQGWIPSPGTAQLKSFDVPGFGKLTATRLRNYRMEVLPPPANAPAGTPTKSVRHESICYYWFVGATDVVPTHWGRVAIDLRDRLTKGYNERWAMVIMSSEIMSANQRFGHDEPQTDALLAGLIQQLAPKILEPQLKRSLATRPAAPDSPTIALLDRMNRNPQYGGPASPSLASSVKLSP